MIFNESFKVALIYNKDNRKDYILGAKSKILNIENSLGNTNVDTNLDIQVAGNNIIRGYSANDPVVKTTLNNSNNDNNYLPTNGTSNNVSGSKLPTINPDSSDNNVGNSIGIASNNQNKNVKPIPLSTQRKTLIPTSYKLSIKHTRLNKIYNELKKLNVNDYPNAVAVLFRVFVEIGFDYYADVKSINNYSKEKDTLSDKNRKITTYMKTNKIMTNKELKTIEMLSSIPQDKTSINTFNAYVHNGIASPIPDDLKIAWDTVADFISKLYDSI